MPKIVMKGKLTLTIDHQFNAPIFSAIDISRHCRLVARPEMLWRDRRVFSPILVPFGIRLPTVVTIYHIATHLPNQSARPVPSGQTVRLFPRLVTLMLHSYLFPTKAQIFSHTFTISFQE
jgi:hypothetical protein